MDVFLICSGTDTSISVRAGIGMLLSDNMPKKKDLQISIELLDDTENRWEKIFELLEDELNKIEVINENEYDRQTI